MSINAFCPGDVAAVVLAAGRSSRMGAFKPLLPFDGRTLIGHVVTGLRAAGVTRIHVVTGFNAESLAPEIDRLGVTRAHNADFDRGMLSSVQAGVASLRAETEAFLLAPVDVPLVRASTIARLIAAASADDAAVLYPAFRGERGHPPLIRRALFPEILAFDGAGGLSALFARREAEARDVPVFDWGCLEDMDRPEDHRRLAAAFLRRNCPDASECQAMLESAATPEPVRRHGGAVAAVAADIARRLRAAGEPIEPDRARAAAWLHDIAKGRPHHAEAGAAMVSAFGFPELADAIERHADLQGERRLDEAAVVFLADKLVQGERRVSLDDRFAPALMRFVKDPEAFAAANRRYAEANAILEAIEARIGRLDPPRDTARETAMEAAL
jgi:molybdenum cofactor cytidylyltransferase